MSIYGEHIKSSYSLELHKNVLMNYNKFNKERGYYRLIDLRCSDDLNSIFYIASPHIKSYNEMYESIASVDQMGSSDLKEIIDYSFGILERLIYKRGLNWFDINDKILNIYYPPYKIYLYGQHLIKYKNEILSAMKKIFPILLDSNIIVSVGHIQILLDELPDEDRIKYFSNMSFFPIERSIHDILIVDDIDIQVKVWVEYI